MRELKRVMLVEDDPDIAVLVQIAIEEFGGLALIHFSSGFDALLAIAADPPDLLLLDYRMPDMNGAEIMSAAREIEVGRDLPIVFMTASLMPSHVERLCKLGALEVIAKPFDPLTLADQLKAIWAAYEASASGRQA